MIPQKSILADLSDRIPTISVGVLSADIMNLSHNLTLISRTDIRILHFDVMDGCFVPQMTAGPPFIKGIQSDLYKDIHLMIKDPAEKVGDYVEAGADMVTVHVESDIDILSILKEIGQMQNRNDADRGIIRGVALHPGTAVSVLEPLLDEVEMVVVLAVDATTRKMPFFPGVYERCASVKKMISASGRKILLSVDGGIKRDNIADIAKIGADIIVSGSAIFKDSEIIGNTNFMLNVLKSSV